MNSATDKFLYSETSLLAGFGFLKTVFRYNINKKVSGGFMQPRKIVPAIGILSSFAEHWEVIPCIALEMILKFS